MGNEFASLITRKLNILLQWEDDKAALVVSNIHYTDYTKVSDILKQLVTNRHLEKARTLSLQGSFFTLKEIDNKNSHCIYYNWSVTDDLVLFLFKARLNILPTNFTLHIWNR